MYYHFFQWTNVLSQHISIEVTSHDVVLRREPKQEVNASEWASERVLRDWTKHTHVSGQKIYLPSYENTVTATW